MAEPLATCAKCGRTIPVSASAEAYLVAKGAMVEFYHCANRTECDSVCRFVRTGQ